MKNEDIENVNDRELFSELFDNLIHPLVIHVVPPFIDKKDPMFHPQINGEAIWKWREVYLAYIKIEKLLKTVAKHLLMHTVQH